METRFSDPQGATQQQLDLIRRMSERLEGFAPAKLALENVMHTVDVAIHAERQRVILNGLMFTRTQELGELYEQGFDADTPRNDEQIGAYRDLGVLLTAMQTLLVYAPQHHETPQKS